MKTPNKPMIFVTEGGVRELEPDKLIKLVLSEENYARIMTLAVWWK